MDPSDPLESGDHQFPLTSLTWPVNQDPLQQLMTSPRPMSSSWRLSRLQSHPGAVKEEEEGEEFHVQLERKGSLGGGRVRTISGRKNSLVLGIFNKYVLFGILPITSK